MMAEDPSSTPDSLNEPNIVTKCYRSVSVRYQSLLDHWTPHARSRWVFAFVLILLFILRILVAQGWYIVTYALGIYHLNLFIAFLTPKIDPALDYEDDGLGLPTHTSREFRPFIRRLPEFKFWLGIVKSSLIGLFCTFFDCFNVPVFWPILVMYFITLFCITMKRQIRHMIKSLEIPLPLLIQDACKSETLRRSVKFKSVLFWNSLPAHWEMTSLTTPKFKKLLTNFIISKR